jgi:glucosylceramidase
MKILRFGVVSFGFACALAAGACSKGSGGGGGTAVDGPVSAQLVTSANGAFWQTDGQITQIVGGGADVTVNDSAAAQTWDGFGGAFNEMGWNVLSMLSSADRATALQLLFGADGAHFNLGRIPIGASDYAMDRYTLDETANDTSMANFSISRDMQKLIPYVQAALAVNPSMRLWASPWTPPTWMKTTSGSANGTSCALIGSTMFDGGCMIDDDATLKAHARYFVKFVQQYGQQGITIDTIAPQNEPNYAQGYPSALWPAALFTKFVGQYLGRALDAAGLSTKIMLGTMSNGNSAADPAIVSSVMGDATAKSYIKVLGFQWGMQTSVAGAKAYNLPIWQTEHQAGNYPWAGGFNASMAPNDFAYAVESWGLIRDWIKTGVSSYSAWNMVLDTTGLGLDTTRVWPQDALLTVDTTAKTLNVTPAYYVFRHFSQFVAPGATVVATSGGDAIGFKNPDGSVVAVVYNAGGARNYRVALAGQTLQFAMPANGWATIVSQ